MRPPVPRNGGRIPPARTWGELGVAEYGHPRGRPILYFHGFPGSRLEASVADAIAASLGIRLVAFDRPGMGRSPFLSGRTIPDIAFDVARLADGLGIGRFAVLGVSGGAPYALACGLRLPARVDRIGLISPAGPFAEKRYQAALGWSARTLLRLASLAPPLYRRALRKVSRLLSADAERFLRRTAERLGAPDREVLLGNLPLFAENLREAFYSGDDGFVREAELLARPWGFRPDEVRQPVLLWHGGRDRTIPLSVGMGLAGEIPGCEAFCPPDEGHFSLAFGWMREILSTLLTGRRLGRIVRNRPAVRAPRTPGTSRAWSLSQNRRPETLPG